MKIFVPTTANLERFCINKTLEGSHLTPTYVANTDEQVFRLMRHLPGTPIYNAGVTGVAKVRDFIHRNFVRTGEWYVMMDDNLKGLRGLEEEPWYNEERLDFDIIEDWRERFADPVPSSRFAALITELIQVAQQNDTIFAGFSTEGNYFFRPRKWQRLGVVCGALCVVKKVSEDFWDPGIYYLDDLAATVQTVARHGSVLVNRWITIDKEFYQPGGSGTRDVRLEKQIADAHRIMQDYPGLVKPPRQGLENAGGHLSFAITNHKQLQTWRSEHGYVNS